MEILADSYKKAKCIFECFLYVFVWIFIYLIVSIILPFDGININFLAGFTLFLSILVLTKLFKSYKPNLLKFENLPKITIKSLLYIFITAFMLNILFSAILDCFSSFEFVKTYILSTSNLLSDGNIIINFIFIALLMPILEEILFRGYIQSKLSMQFNTFSAIVIQALIYSLIHLDIIQSLYTFILGIFLGIIMYNFNNLLIPIIFHITFNSTNLLINMIFSNHSSIVLSVGINLVIIIIVLASLKWLYKDKTILSLICSATTNSKQGE